MTALYPTSTKINPSAPEDAQFFDRGQVAMIFKTEAGTLRVATTFGRPAHALGASIEARHDQTGRLLGYWRVIGWRTFATGEVVGEVPDKKVAHLVYK